MGKISLNTPLDEKTIRGLKSGDIIYLNGIVYQLTTAHSRALEYFSKGKVMPVNFKDQVIWHAYASLKKDEANNCWVLQHLGSTTSKSFEIFEPDFIRKFGPRAVMGKGGMGAETIKAMKERGCIYLSQVGGCAAYYTCKIEEISCTIWEDLGGGMIVGYKVKDLGPFIVAIDSFGESIYEKIEQDIKKRLPSLREKFRDKNRIDLF